MSLCLAAPRFETIYGGRGLRLLRRWALVVVGLPLSSETNYWSCAPQVTRSGTTTEQCWAPAVLCTRVKGCFLAKP